MSIEEVFPNPLVKRVIFQIRFPNLFYIEDKIGEFQLKIMEQFPKSSMIFEKQIVFNIGYESEIKDEDKKKLDQGARKVWKFENDEKVQVNVYSDSLSITSESHKTYNNDHAGNKFRDTINFVVGSFIEIVKIPIILRIGFRYMDEYPMGEMNNEIFSQSFNPAFNIDRFDVSKALNINFQTNLIVGDKFFNYAERIEKKENNWLIHLDFDAFAKNIKAVDYLEITDKLHEINSQEFETVIKEPVYQYMRNID
ncbi:TIGR04255 family protein [Maribellus comscasis]|uniref:TIGR04255 family protein n=1 Tax=Maribellus comscasis TaxID=2681766 RepID=A0A6I6JYF6_9BACT|nr:TIGR04255 family protein [Maribellus comscasis]QGY44173.1 TIGR04255 family protein [Maribellus comscasis]